MPVTRPRPRIRNAQDVLDAVVDYQQQRNSEGRLFTEHFEGLLKLIDITGAEGNLNWTASRMSVRGHDFHSVKLLTDFCGPDTDLLFCQSVDASENGADYHLVAVTKQVHVHDYEDEVVWDEVARRAKAKQGGGARSRSFKIEASLQDPKLFAFSDEGKFACRDLYERLENAQLAMTAFQEHQKERLARLKDRASTYFLRYGGHQL